jgi:hypothetical protein
MKRVPAVSTTMNTSSAGKDTNLRMIDLMLYQIW